MMREQIRRHSLASFLVVTFGWSWGLDALFFAFDWWHVPFATVPRTWGPLIGTVIVVWASDRSLRTWFSRALDWRHRPTLYLLALFVPLFITNVRPFLRALGGGSLTYFPVAPPHLVAVNLFAVMFLAGGLEEFGWRGFLQPRLQKHASVFVVGLVVGVVWWLWHIPLFFTGDPNFALDSRVMVDYTTFIVGAAVVYGALVNVSGGSVLPVMLMHASVNQPALVGGSGGVLDGSPLVDALGPGLWWLLVVVLILAYGRSMSPGSGVKPLSTSGPDRSYGDG